MDNYASLSDAAMEVVAQQTRPTTAPRAAANRPATASRSANQIIKEASALAACAELQLPIIIGTDPRVLRCFVAAALQTEIDAASIAATATATGLYVSCRVRATREKLFVAFKGRQFLAPSSAELTHILDEAMTLSVLRNSPDAPPESLVKRFPIVAHPELYRSAEKIIFVTLVKDHLESCFRRDADDQFHYNVHFNDLMWADTLQCHFYSLRHFTEALAANAVQHPFRKWLFLFAFQGRLQSTCVDGGNAYAQALFNETFADEDIAATWERLAELSRGPGL